ncbi:uncharacterized protein LOC144480561 isoform X2 [Mustelus asterias]
MALGALSVGLLLLFHHATGSTYLHFRGSGDVTTLQCNTPTGAGNVGTLCSIRDFSAEIEIEKIQCETEEKKMQDCENIDHEKQKEKLQCQTSKRNESEMNSLTFDVMLCDDSMIFTCTVQDSTESSKCPNWKTLTGEGCENHNLFFVINPDDSDEVFSAVETSSSLTVAEGENVTLPCQFENRKSLPFTLLWIISGNINKCLHSVHIEGYSPHSNTHCCVDKESSQRISNQSSNNPTNKIQTHNLTIHSVKELDTGSYLCVVHGQASGKPVWKITANISLSVTKSADSPDTHTSTSGISPVTSSATPTNNEDQVTRSPISSSESPDTLTSTSGISPVTNNSNHKIIPVIIGIVCVVVLICIVGVICIVRRKRQMAKGLPYSVFPSREQTDENEHVAYAVTTVPMTKSQLGPGEGQGAHSTSASTEHVYCLIKESVQGNGDKTETQGGKCKDHLNHGSQVESSSAIEPKDHTSLKEEDPIASSNDQTYSLISYPGTESLGNTVTQPRLEENDPKHCPLEMEENPIYSKMEDN